MLILIVKWREYSLMLRGEDLPKMIGSFSPVRPKRKPKPYLLRCPTETEKSSEPTVDIVELPDISDIPLKPDKAPLKMKENSSPKPEDDFLLGDEYIYDEYECFRPGDNNETYIKNKMKERTSKISWCDTPDFEKKKKEGSYLNEAASDLSTSKGIYAISFGDETFEEDASSCGELSTLTPKRMETKRGKFIFETITSKIDDLKNFCRKNLTKSFSLDEVPTKIKYEKIRSSMSTTF